MTLTEAFGGLQDPRTGPAQRHDLREMILMALCAVLCGADTWVDVAEWAEDNASWLRRYLVLERGTPSHDTFGRVFRILDAKVFEQCFRGWISGLVGVIGGVVALDGKTLLHWLDRPIRQHWPKLAGVGMVERTREINGKTSTGRAFYIGSKGILDAATFANAARSHWGIENKLH